MVTRCLSLLSLVVLSLSQLAATQQLPLEVVDRKVFCARLEKGFAAFAEKNGYTKVQTALMATGASAGLVDDFRAGRTSDYIPAASLAKLASAPARDGYLPIAAFIGHAMGSTQHVTLALSVGELRFIPHAQRGMEIIVIASNAAALTPERAQKVTEVAKSLAVKISVVWVGEAAEDKPEAAEEARRVAWLAAMTGGRFANLGGKDNPCQGPML